MSIKSTNINFGLIPTPPSGYTYMGTNLNGDLSLKLDNGTIKTYGEEGIQGSTGAQGTTGAGVQGSTGSQGLVGAGIQGSIGGQGITGSQGLEGTQGVGGVQGLEGTGIQGSTGSQGVGGIQGVGGVQGLSGESGSGTTGSQGMTGSQGIGGIQGTIGSQGVGGIQGLEGTGVQGSTGSQGVGGVQGSTGSQGVDGVQGTTGSQGVDGVQGTTGSQGSSGVFTGETSLSTALSTDIDNLYNYTGTTDTTLTYLQSQVDNLAASQSQNTRFYFNHNSSDISTYESLIDYVDTLNETTESVVLSASTTEFFIDPYVTYSGFTRMTDIPGGLWVFHFHASITSIAGTNEVRLKLYKRDSGGTETYITTQSADLTSTLITEYSIDFLLTGITMTSTDRLVVKVYGYTTGGSRTLSWVYGSSSNFGYIEIPLTTTSGYALTSQLDTEISERTSGDLSLSTAITNVNPTGTTSLSSALSTEISIRSSEVLSLSTAIINVTGGTGGTGETSLSSAFSIEISIRGSADTSLSTSIDILSGYTNFTEIDLNTLLVEGQVLGKSGGVLASVVGGGAQGTTGSQGAVGSQGVDGAGSQGATGAQGYNGADGSQGAVGAGSQGATGAQGVDGAVGATYLSGLTDVLMTNLAYNDIFIYTNENIWKNTGSTDITTLVGEGDIIFRSGNTLSGTTNTRSIGLVINNGANIITTGSKGYREIDDNYTISSWTILSDVSGSTIIDVKKCDYTNFPTTTSIAGSEKPTLSNEMKNQDLSLSTWTTSLSRGDILEFYVDSSNLSKIWLYLKLTKRN